MNKVFACLKLSLFALACLAAIVLQSIIFLFTRGPQAYIVPFLWQKAMCRVFGIRVEISGTPYRDSQTLYVSNHLSYLDILALGSLLKASFVAKREVAKMPLFGYLSTLQQTAYISRARTDASAGKNALTNMLSEGKSLILFPEGTSTDGREVLPFKSSLFALMIQDGTRPLMIQPVTVKMNMVDGHSVQTQDDRDLYAWHRDMDMELHHHLWRFAQSKGAVISLLFHDAFDANQYEDRKVLANTCHDIVSKGLDNQQDAAAA